MLGLFQDEEINLSGLELKQRAQELFVSALNKGSIPSWEDFYKELPTLREANDLFEVKNTFYQLTKWPFLEELLKNNANEFFLHSEDNIQILKLDSTKETVKVNLNSEEWQLWLEVLSIHFKKNWNTQNPFVSFYADLFGGHYRLSLVHFSTSPKSKSKLIIRRISGEPFTISSFGNTDSVVDLVKNKKNILISGSTGSGKTSFLTSLLEQIQADEHLVILEDTFEIITRHNYTTRFLSGSTNETSLNSYLSYSLRLSPDRIVLGEMRSHEVVPFLMAMNTGHKGLMGTIHASSAYDALHRIALLFSLYSTDTNVSYDRVMDLICKNLEYVVFMENKKVKEVIKILGSDKGNAFYETIEGKNDFNLF